MCPSERPTDLVARRRALLARHGLSEYDDLLAELDLDRIAYTLGYVDELEHRASHPEAVELAVWFAGVEQLPGPLSEDVRRLLEVLTDHDPADDDGDGQVLSDAKLAILGAPADEYRRHAEGLRIEKAERLQQIEALLRRDSIYRTPEMRAGREARAQLNLARERAALITTVNSAKSPRAHHPVR